MFGRNWLGSQLKVLFLCTSNSSRSIIAQAILNEIGRNRFEAFSAGSRPKSLIHPATVSLLERKGYAVAGLRSKSGHEYAAPGGPAFDYVITLCNDALRDAPPKFRGKAAKTHWDIPDPSSSTDEQATYEQAYAMLLARIGTLVYGSKARI